MLDSTLDLSCLSGFDLNLEQYLGLWSIEETFFHQQWDMIRRMDLVAHVQNATPRSAASASEPDSAGIVRIDIRGTMTKQGSSLSSAGSTVRVKQAVRDARRNPDVSGVLFVIDSPGGTVAGTAELADEMHALSDEKPTVTLVEDLMASAGMYVGVQSRKVFANTPNAIVGSMGVFIGLYDMSGMAAKEGIRPVVIKTGELKGAGFPGAEITDAQRAMWQGLADESFIQFTAAVQRRRPLSADQMKELSRAGVYPAKQAIGLGLIDGIRSYDAAVGELRSMISPKRKGAKARMDTERPQAATLTELERACDGATPDFLLGQMRGGATVESAQQAWSRQQNATILDLRGQITARDNTIKALQDQATATKTAHDAEVTGLKATAADWENKFKSKGSFNPVNQGGGSSQNGESATAQWNAAKAALVASGMDAASAVQKLVKENPALHQAYVAEANSGRK